MTEQQIADALDELVSLTLEGKWETAFEKHYHTDLEKTDLDGHVVKGKTTNFEKGRIFSSKISNVRDFSNAGKMVNGNRSFLIWSLDFDVDGEPFKMVEVAVQDWKENKIIRERYFA